MGDRENYNVEEDISISKEPVYLKNKRLSPRMGSYHL